MTVVNIVLSFFQSPYDDDTPFESVFSNPNKESKRRQQEETVIALDQSLTLIQNMFQNRTSNLILTHSRMNVTFTLKKVKAMKNSQFYKLLQQKLSSGARSASSKIDVQH